MRRWLSGLLASLWKKLQPPPVQPDVKTLMRENLILRQREMFAKRREDYIERMSELAEAKQMSGSGPWTIGPGALRATDNLLSEAAKELREAEVQVRENTLPATNGYWGELDLLLDTAEWRRESHLSWMEFSRWGIQQIILISRLYWMKNPLIRRSIDIAAVYVFGRNVEVSSPDEKVNLLLADFFEANKSVLGHCALVDQERRKYYDGNIFWVFFADVDATGQVKVRTIDATEIQEIVSNPDDSEDPWYYLRQWSQQNINYDNGVVASQVMYCWYPALGYDPDVKPDKMRGYPVMWKQPVHHRKVGAVSKWKFGCPRIYPALDWGKTAKKYLEACYTTTQAHAQIAWQFSTKGGQAAIAGAKGQLETTISTAPGNSMYDTNPTAVAASVFASGPGTSVKPMQTRGAGGDPSEVKEYKVMVAIVVGIPPTWLGDLETANLSTATTLDRPTELGFEEKQEEWREDLLVMCRFAILTSAAATSGQLRESFGNKKLVVRAGAIRRTPAGRRIQEAKKPEDGSVEIAVNFPAIREGDLPLMVKAVVEAMTLDNKGGLIPGIDEKAGVKMLFRLLDYEEGDDVVEQMYPEAEYEIDRTKIVEPDPALPAFPTGGIQPQPANVPVKRGKQQR